MSIYVCLCDKKMGMICGISSLFYYDNSCRVIAPRNSLYSSDHSANFTPIVTDFQQSGGITSLTYSTPGSFGVRCCRIDQETRETCKYLQRKCINYPFFKLSVKLTNALSFSLR